MQVHVGITGGHRRLYGWAAARIGDVAARDDMSPQSTGEVSGWRYECPADG